MSQMALMENNGSIITPVSLGNNNGAGSANTLALTASAAIQTGDTVIVATTHFNNNTNIVSTISDGTNTYTKLSSATNTNQETELWRCINCVAVASPVITVTWNGSITFRWVGACRIANIFQGVDTVPTGTSGTSTSPSITSATLSGFGREMAVGFISANGLPTYTEATGFSTIQSDTASGIWNSMSFSRTYTTSAVTFNPGLTSSMPWTALMTIIY